MRLMTRRVLSSRHYLAVIFTPGGVSGDRVTKTFTFTGAGFDTTTSGGSAYVPVLMRSPLKVGRCRLNLS